MKKHIIITVIITGMIFIISMCPQAFGAGFALYEHGARGVSLGGAIVARADDPSAIFYNPAGITQLEGTWVMAGVSAIIPKLKIVNASGREEETKDREFFPPHIYFTKQLDKNYWLGVGIFSPFGLGTEFDSHWSGRYNSYNASLETLVFNPNLMFKASDTLSVAFGLSLQWAEAEIQQKINPAYVIMGKENEIKMGIAQSTGYSQDSDNVDLIYKTKFLNASTALGDIDQRIKGDNTSTGFNIALHYKPSDRLSFGITYRSGITQKLDGNAYYQNVKDMPDVFNFSDYFYNAKGRAELRMPDFLFIGAAYKIRPGTTIEADAWQTGWSSYNELPLYFQNGLGNQIQPKHYSDVWSFRLGLEHKYNEKWTARLGYVYDQSPIPDNTIDFMLPSNDRQLYNAGVGFIYNKYYIDLFYSYLLVKDRHINERPKDMVLEGDTKGDSHIMGVTISYKF